MSILKQDNINVEIKLTASWASLMFCYVYGDYFELYVPRKTAGLVSGDNLLDSPMKLFAAAFLLSLPALMILLSVLLKPKINRLLNLIFGAFYSLITFMTAATSVSSWLAFYAFLAIVETAIAVQIVWRAWRWPKLPANE